MRKFILTLCLFSLSFSTFANLSKSTDSGVITIQGTLGENQIFVRKYKDSGICYTNGKLNGKEFAMETYKEAGDLYTNGSVPELIETTLSHFGLSAYKCAIFGFFN